MSFWGELKRRNVVKVAVAYLIVAWLIVQVANTFFPIFGIPGWAVTLVASLLILGLPITLIIAWAFELTPEGIKKTEYVPLEESITHVTGKKLNYILVGVIVLAVAYILFDNFYLDRRIAKTDASKTIAVLPFENLSSDPEQEYFVDGLSEELLNCLAKINDLKVTSRTSSFAYKDTDKTLHEVAGVLGVDHILEGSVRKAGDKLRITAQLIRVADDSHLWSNTYDRELKDIFAIQEDIATAVADELKATLGIKYSFKQLRGTDNEKAYEYYVFAQGIADESSPNFIEKFSRALEYIDTAIGIDPDFARAWALKASIHITMLAGAPIGLADSLREDALNEAQKAVELNPDLAAGYFSLGHVKLGKGDWIGAESAFHKALELSDETMSYTEFHYTAVYYMAVGYFKKAVDILAEWLRNDPLNASRSIYIQALTCLGDHQQAKEEFENAIKLQGDSPAIKLNWIFMNMRPGIKIPLDTEKIDVTPYSLFAIPVKNFESPEKGLKELRQLYQDEKDLPTYQYCFSSIFAAYLGDFDFAVDILGKAYDIDSGSMQFAWLPVMHDVRKLPRFKEFIREIGLVDYWEQFGWPDICRPLENGDFECD